jgi:probable phosphoglycerate mutase
MAELWLVRHGQTDWNLAGRYQGQSDIPLNATGLAQAGGLAKQLAGSQFVALYSSDLKRAQRTAEILGEFFGLTVQVDPRLREICQGEWEGKNYQEVVRQYSSAQVEGIRNPAWVTAAAPGGESTLQVAARMKAAADDIAARYPFGHILVVSHGFALASLVCQAEGIPLAEIYQHIPDNARATVVQWKN